MAQGTTLSKGRWEYRFATPNTNKTPTLKLRVPSNPKRNVLACEKDLHRILARLEGGAAYNWEVSRCELEFWEALPTIHKSALIERQYSRCFLCNLDSEMASPPNAGSDK